MNMELPDDWGSEPVSEFLHSAYSNNVSFFANYSEVPFVQVIREINILFKQFTERDFKIDVHVLPNFVTRSHSAFLGSIRLATSCEAVESYMVSRGCLEYALYALHIYEDKEYVYINNDKTVTEDRKDSNSQSVQKRFMIWLDRSTSPEANKKRRNEFSNSNVKKTLLVKNEDLGKIVLELYDSTIDYGAHPNIGGVLSTSTISLNGVSDEFLLHHEDVVFKAGVQNVILIGLCSLFIFYLIFKEHFNSNICTRLNELAKLFPKNLKKFSL